MYFFLALDPYLRSALLTFVVKISRRVPHPQAAEVAQALRASKELHLCRALVEETGCALQPDWACGAWLLVPLTREESSPG